MNDDWLRDPAELRPGEEFSGRSRPYNNQVTVDPFEGAPSAAFEAQVPSGSQ